MFKLRHIKEDNGMWNLKASFCYCGHQQQREFDTWHTLKEEAIGALKYLVYSYFVMQCRTIFRKCADATTVANHSFPGNPKRSLGFERTGKYLEYMYLHDGEAERALGYWLADKSHWKAIVPPRTHPWNGIIVEHMGDLFFTATHMLNEWKKPIAEQFTLKITQAA